MNLEHELHSDLIEIYQRAKKECGYNANRFLQIVSNTPPVQAVKSLIVRETDGFSTLCQLHRLDLSVEAVVLKNKYSTLFNQEERDICKNRLLQAGYQFE